MRKVRFLDEPKEEKKPVEFTHLSFIRKGWERTKNKPSQFNEVIYLGRCTTDGDMFCVKRESGSIEIYKGHLNDGVYE